MLPPEIVVLDHPHDCGYLPGRTARLPYRHPVNKLTPEVFDQRLAEGDRRSGLYLYRTHCPACRACQPIRLEVDRFRPNATQRRTLRRGNELLTTRIGLPLADAARVALYNRHLFGRGLSRGQGPLSEDEYADFLTNSCCETIELSYWHGDRLVAIAIADLGQDAVSAVYCHYEPDFAPLSLGTYSVLRQVEFCRQTGRRLLYLGFFIAESEHMRYKAVFSPHQRLIAGVWQDFA
jgi:arginine-tRNA-protein transferase